MENIKNEIIKIEGLKKGYDNLEVLKGIDLSINKGETISFIGASGGGKSTLLRCINLLEEYHSGRISYKGQDIRAKDFSLSAYRQKVGMIFQRFNLFNNMSVLANVNLGQIKVLKRSKEEATRKSLEMLEKVGMADFAGKDVKLLSGGQMQRVAIARSLAMDPEVLLLDEPTSALDPQMVNEVLEVIKTIAKEGLTLVIVTHEMSFAKDISDRVIFLKEGRIHEEGSSYEIFNNPKTEALKKFLRSS